MNYVGRHYKTKIKQQVDMLTQNLKKLNDLINQFEELNKKCKSLIR